MTVPLIGLTTKNILHAQYGDAIPLLAAPRSYSDALIKAGATPVLMPVILPLTQLDAMLDRLDGIILTGGGDIDPQLYHGQAHEKVYDVDPQRDRIEITLARRVIERQKPFVAICRGFQVLNVALGGALYSHIADQMEGAIEHSAFPQHPTDFPAHDVEINPDSKLSNILGKTQLKVNSLHHQGVSQVGKGLTVTATAADGLVEGVEVQGHPFGVAVQWHPEWMPESKEMQALFTAFVQAAGGS